LPNPTEDLAKHVIEVEPLYDNRGTVTLDADEWDEILDLAMEVKYGDNVQG
jgi:hypothetical protein